MTFFKTKKGIIITAVIASVLVLSIAIGSIFLFKGKDKTDDGSSTDTSGASSDNSIVIDDIENTNAQDEDENFLEPDETEADKILEEYKNKTESQASGSASAPSTTTKPSTQTQPSVNTTPNEPTNTGNNTGNNTGSNNGTFGGKKYVQDANPDTGISWDGVSPIIYTYPDGTTGTEKREGAKYEQAPGITTTVVTINHAPEELYDGHCERCGKVGGDGTNGTCLSYWTGGDHVCPNCNVTVPQSTCHTCKS